MLGLLRSAPNSRTFDGYVDTRGTAFSRLIWRSDVPVEPSEEDRQILLDNKITTIIDMRTAGEVQRQRNALSEDERFVYLWYPIEEGSAPPKCLDDVPLSYMSCVGSRGAAAVFKAIADAEDGVLFHCSAGKDRTGVISAVLLLLCDADRDTIVRDYVQSRYNNKERLERFLREHPEADVDVVMAREQSMERFLDMFAEAYGTAESFLSAAGLTAGQIERIRSKMLG